MVGGALPGDAVPAASWPEGTPLRLSGDVSIDGAGRAGVWWLLGQRLGGEGRGLRDMLPRFGPDARGLMSFLAVGLHRYGYE